VSIFDRLFRKRRAPRTDAAASQEEASVPVPSPGGIEPPVMPRDRPVADDAAARRSPDDPQTERQTGQ
jgi:hypothetical protein